MEIETTFLCACCLQVNTITVDGSGGKRQQYVEDCQVCCRPNVLLITICEDRASAEVQSEAE